MTKLPDLTLRQLETREEYEACVRLQRDTWGEHFLDVVPATILMVAQRVGGVTAGAFDPDGRLLGFVFGISGVRQGKPAHWSDMLAVRPELRGLGLGKRLKRLQRELLLESGIKVAYWTYDPLVVRNARLNLTVLGAVPVEYVVNMYGDTGSLLHSGLDTDRFVVEWRLDDPQVERALAGASEELPPEAFDSPVVNPNTITGNAPLAQSSSLPTVTWVRVAIPPDIEQVKTTAPEDAWSWQLATRRAFQWYFANGYRVAGFRSKSELHHDCYLVTNQTKAG
jgi:predicted GNAT superfamily acetyltransferase